MDQGIYKIINVVNNKFYIGSAVSLRKRKARHFSELRTHKHNNQHLQRAWDKYGEQSFVFAVVELVEDRTQLLAAENRWLKEHVGQPYCYNLGRDATAPMLGMAGALSPTWGYVHTPEAREAIGHGSRGRLHQPESKQKIRQWLVGKPKSAEVRAKISATLSGAGNPNYGKPRSAEFVAKVSKAVVVRSPDGKHTVFDSISVLRAEMGLKPSTANRALKSGMPIARGPLKGWSMRYVDR